MSKRFRRPLPEEQAVLDRLPVGLLERHELARCNGLLQQHHYLGSVKPVGERLSYVATDPQGQWLALLIFAAAAKHLKYRDQWIGWTAAQREGRLALVANNLRFLLLPERTFPNLGTRVLRRVLARLRDDWQAAYGHPVLVVETFVDPEQFCGTVYTANGWEELGRTDGSGRHQRDYYVRHDKPKRLFVRELGRQARRSLQARHLQPALAAVEAKAGPKSRQTVKDNQPTLRQNIEQLLPAPKADSPPWKPTPTQFRTLDYEKSRLVSRSIQTQSVSAEQVCFPLAAQAARLLRQTQGRPEEHLALLTSAPPEKLDAQKWLALNRAGFGGIENGLHQRLDVSHNDDRCRIRSSPALFVAGLFRRLANSLFMEWRSHQLHPGHLTTTDFQSARGEDQGRRALRLILNQQPSLKPP